MILAGDLNVKAKEKDDNRKGEFDEMRKVLEQYNIFFRSDTSGKIATHFNYNGGRSQVDYVAASQGFFNFESLKYIQFHESGDHVALQVCFKLPSSYFKSKTV